MTHGQFLASRYTPALLATGAAGGALLALSVTDEPLSQDFWKEVLKIVSLSAIPLVVLAMRAPFGAGGNWRARSAIAVYVALLVVLLVVGVRLHEVAAVIPEGQDAAAPEAWKVFVVCIGTGLTIAALALGVVLAFFIKDKEVSPLEPPRGGH